eukprot:9479554-Pyramimonas_sp.AAC.1
MRAVPYFAALVAMLERIMVRTIPDILLLLVLTLGFSAANHVLLRLSPYYSFSYGHTLLRHLLRYIFGDTGIFEYESETRLVDDTIDVDDGLYLDAHALFRHKWVPFAVFIAVNVVFMYFTIIIFFNLLIARMGSIYEEVEERQLSSVTRSVGVINEEYQQKWRLLCRWDYQACFSKPDTLVPEKACEMPRHPIVRFYESERISSR